MRRLSVSKHRLLFGAMVLAALPVAHADQPLPPAASEGPKCLSPWFIYQDEHSIEQLKPAADLLESISVCGDAPAAFIAECHALGIDAYKLVGGEPEAFDTESHREATIRNYVRLCQEQGYDGIDLDFEGLDASLREPYSALMQDASRELHRLGKKLSICVSYVMCTRKTASGNHMEDFYDPRIIGQTCDIVRVMCYDMYSLSGGAAGPVSTQPWAKDAMKYWLRYIARERLVMGLPAYSGDFELVPDGRKERFYSAPEPLIPEGAALQRIWLPYEQVNSYTYLGQDGHMHIFYASDAASTAAHLETARRLGIPRIGFWHLAAVTPEMWDKVRQWTRLDAATTDAYPWMVFP